MKLKRIKNIKFRYDTITICYARNGHTLYKGLVSNIPEYLLEYYVTYRIDNKIRNVHYIEVIENEK